jgi:hypothetical protein
MRAVADMAIPSVLSAALLGAAGANPSVISGPKLKDGGMQNLLANVAQGGVATTAAVEPANAKTVAPVLPNQITDTQPAGGTWTAAERAEINAVLNKAVTQEEKAALFKKISQGNEDKLLALLSLLIPVALNGWRVDANQVAYWKDLVPAVKGVLT